MPEDDAKVVEDVDSTSTDDKTTDADATVDADKDWQAEFEAQKKVNRSLERKTKADMTRINGLESDLKGLREGVAKKSEGDATDADAIKAEATREANTAANGRILKAEVRAAAAGKLADPADAYRFLDLTKFEVDDDGNVDEDDIADAIDDLVKKKPYLAVQDGKRFKGTADGGTRKETRPSQLTKANLAGMSPEAIEEARIAGRLVDLMQGKTS